MLLGEKMTVRPSAETSHSKNDSISGVKPYCAASACSAAVLASILSESSSPAASAIAEASTSAAASAATHILFALAVLFSCGRL